MNYYWLFGIAIILLWYIEAHIVYQVWQEKADIRSLLFDSAATSPKIEP